MAANKYAGEVEITLDKRRILKMTIAAAAKFAGVTGVSVQKFMMEMGRAASRKEMVREDWTAALLWAMLLHEEPLLSVERAAELMDLAPGGNDSEKMLYTENKMLEAWCNKQGIDFSKVMESVPEEGRPDRPPETKTESPSS